MPDAQHGFGLYVHWPFCLSKCPYCDFNSHVRAKIDAAAWQAALVRELETTAARLNKRPPIDSIFFGGGTPSLMPGKIVGDVLATAEKLFGFSPDIEITLEANPTSVDAERFRDYRAAGVNRVSLGVQALNDTDLRALGRLHTVDEALRAVALAQSTFPRASFDLIYARPGQTLAAWRAELDRALAQGCSHYSLYQLTFEEGTPFHAALARGTMKELDVEGAAALYEFTQARMSQAGMPAYEVSNHASAGQESRHNLIYWRYGDYLGIGPGAHGRLTVNGDRIATTTHRQPEAWLAHVTKDGHGIDQWVAVASHDQGTEALLMGMRLTEGVDIGRIENLLGRTLPSQQLTDLRSQGLIELSDQRLRATARGRLVLNTVLKKLVA
ncbi:MAG: radical SAM family heme chaperone HemW [Alphaproteobacteria bacterium]|nr:radical SAM family heme chaperone HemW [Alphaproteobacteria bacterium]